MCAAFYYEKNVPNFAIGGALNETTSLTSLPFTFDKRHYKKDSRFVNDLYTLTYDDHESLDSVRLFSTFANQVSGNLSVRACVCIWIAQRYLFLTNPFISNFQHTCEFVCVWEFAQNINFCFGLVFHNLFFVFSDQK